MNSANESGRVARGQLYRDLAPDMKPRDRRMRATSIEGGVAIMLVEHDLGGQVGRQTKASLARLQSKAFELIEDPADTDPLYLALLAEISGIYKTDSTPADYARAALRAIRAQAGECQPLVSGEV